MKAKNTISISIFFLLAVIFTSCSTSIDIAKRQFNNGYYVHVASKRQAINPVKNIVADVEEDQSVTANRFNTESASAGPVVQDEKRTLLNVVSVVPHKNRLKKTIDNVFLTENTVAEGKGLEFKKHGYVRKIHARRKIHFFSGGSVPGIILLILCILLPPLAILLLDDHTSQQFWLDVLLCLFFWVPGVIYALIVCFS